jgi:hypothetical protein
MTDLEKQFPQLAKEIKEQFGDDVSRVSIEQI